MMYLHRTRRPRPAARTAGRAFRVLVSSLALIAVLAPTAHASKGDFHTSCDLSHVRSDDPIVYPGQPGASHLHDFFGNASTDASSTYRSMRAGNTTCSFAGDTSGYWSPALVNRSGGTVKPTGMTAYYLARGQVKAPPTSASWPAAIRTSLRSPAMRVEKALPRPRCRWTAARRGSKGSSSSRHAGTGSTSTAPTTGVTWRIPPAADVRHLIRSRSPSSCSTSHTASMTAGVTRWCPTR